MARQHNTKEGISAGAASASVQFSVETLSRQAEIEVVGAIQGQTGLSIWSCGALGQEWISVLGERTKAQALFWWSKA